MKKIALYIAYTLLFLMTPLFPANAENPAKASVAELERLVNTHLNTPKEPGYWQALLDRGLEIDSLPIIDKALLGLSTYYYYEKDADKVNYWAQYTDSLMQSRNLNPDVYYDVHRNRIIFILTYRELEEAIRNIVQLFNRAQDTSQEYGMVCASELLGAMYQVCHHDSAALVAYQDASERLDKIGGHTISRIRLLSYLVEMHIYLGNLKEAEALIGKYEDLLKKREKEKITKGIIYDKDKFNWMLHSFQANLYLQQNQLDKAKKSLNKASTFYSNSSSILEFSTYYYLFVKASYQKAIHQYDEALATIRPILDKSQDPDAMSMKADILSETGHFKEVVVLYGEIDKIKQINNNDGLIRQMNNLRILYDKNNQIIQEKEVMLNNLEAAENHRFLIYSATASAALLILSLILLRFLRRTHLLKNALEEEKKSLIISKEKLNLEKRKAEEANRMKNIFVANISHEIRTPLNAIVGFSTLLAEGEIEEEDKPEYIGLINKNSGLLLTLVNDVLDLSKMEAGHFRLNIEPCEITDCCRKAMESVKDKLVEGVTLSFTPQVSPYTLDTDAQQLYQLLYNLLDNAAKFTLAGNIDLTLKVKAKEEQVCFIITDSGPGIPEDKRETIFDRFEKLDEYSQGTGLGLAICRTIAEQLGGVLFVDPNYINGTRFVFIHPFKIPRPEAESKE